MKGFTFCIRRPSRPVYQSVRMSRVERWPVITALGLYVSFLRLTVFFPFTLWQAWEIFRKIHSQGEDGSHDVDERNTEPEEGDTERNKERDKVDTHSLTMVKREAELTNTMNNIAKSQNKKISLLVAKISMLEEKMRKVKEERKGKSQQNEDSDDLHQQTNIEDSEDDCSGISETKISYLLKTLNPESFLDSTLGTDNQPQVPTTSQSEMV